MKPGTKIHAKALNHGTATTSVDANSRKGRVIPIEKKLAIADMMMHTDTPNNEIAKLFQVGRNFAYQCQREYKEGKLKGQLPSERGEAPGNLTKVEEARLDTSSDADPSTEKVETTEEEPRSKKRITLKGNSGKSAKAKPGTVDEMGRKLASLRAQNVKLRKELNNVRKQTNSIDTANLSEQNDALKRKLSIARQTVRALKAEKQALKTALVAIANDTDADDDTMKHALLIILKSCINTED